MKSETQAKLDQYLREKEAGSLPSPVMAHGPGGLMSHPGMGERKRRRAEFLHNLVNKIGIDQEKAVRLVMVMKHLSGEHNQDKHGHGGGSGGTPPAPSSKKVGNLQTLSPGEKKAPAKKTAGGKTVTGSGVFKKGGQSYAYYTAKVAGKKVFSFDGGKSWAVAQLDAFISAAGGYNAAYPILSQR